MQDGRGRVMVVRTVLALLPLLIAAVAFGISQTGRVVQDRPFTWKEFPLNFDISMAPLALHGTLFSLVAVGALLCWSRADRRWLRGCSLLLWSAVFAFAYFYVLDGSANALEWIEHRAGIREVGKQLLLAAPVIIFGGATCALLYWSFRSRAIVACCAIATAIAATMFYLLDSDDAETWSPVAWHTLTCLGFSIALWPTMPAHGGCKKCGYDLTGLTSGICPECGTPTADSTPLSNPEHS